MPPQTRSEVIKDTLPTQTRSEVVKGCGGLQT